MTDAERTYLEAATVAVAHQLATFYKALRKEDLPPDEAAMLTMAWLSHTMVAGQITYNTDEQHHLGAEEGETGD